MKLVLLRHGESEWNRENRFQGWADVDLSEKGEGEAHEAGRLMKAEGLIFDVAFTSVLKRAIRTVWIVLDEMDRMWVPVVPSWRLNEKHYGALQGLNKAETAAKYGEEQVQIWRRGYAIAPPPLEESDLRHPGHDPRYASLPRADVPKTESLEATVRRLLPFWSSEIAPALKTGQRILIVAHGNSIRALVKYLDNISDQDIVNLNIPTGVPLVYELDSSLKPLTHYYLGDPEAIKARLDAVANQGRVK